MAHRPPTSSPPQGDGRCGHHHRRHHQGEGKHEVNRTVFVRLLGILAITLGLALTTTTGSASAQFALKAPAPGSQISVQPGAADTAGAPAATAEGQIGAAYTCGFWGGNARKWYTHCGSANSIYIKVEFNYGWANPEYTWVGKGTTNLSYDYRYRDAAITDAWCISNCY